MSIEKDIKENFSKNFSCPRKQIEVTKLTEPVKKFLYQKLKRSFDEDLEYDVSDCEIGTVYARCLYEKFRPVPISCRSELISAAPE